jgi:hypothetical protein
VARALPWLYDDGGRHDAGYTGSTGDCVPRAIAIASGLPYETVYAALFELALAPANMARLELAYGANARRHASPRDGVPRRIYQTYLESLGFTWRATMSIGSGCTVHMAAGELPSGSLVCRLSRHVTAVVDGVCRDTYDPSRDGTRCVYGYFSRGELADG